MSKCGFKMDENSSGSVGGLCVCVCLCLCVCVSVLVLATEFHHTYSPSKLRSFWGSEDILAGRGFKVWVKLRFRLGSG